MIINNSRISVYIKGNNSPSSYYRVIQFVNKLSNTFDFRINMMLNDKLYKMFMPIGNKCIFLKIFFYFLILIRVQFNLCYDYFYKPKIVVINRCLVPRYCPKLAKHILSQLKKRGTKIVWDFDDHILSSKEIDKKTFDFLSTVSDTIIVTHEYLKSLINEKYIKKVILMPTTDGDLYKYFNDSILEQRKESWKDNINIIWVGSSVNLRYLYNILPALNDTAEVILKNYNKKTILINVSNEAIKKEFPYLVIENIKWERDIAIKQMVKSHIGIMPITDSDFAKGKGGFKLIQYISIGLPVIASNVGYNKTIVDKSFGFLVDDANSTKIWEESILNTISNFDEWFSMSKNAFKYWNNFYSFDYCVDSWKKILS